MSERTKIGFALFAVALGIYVLAYAATVRRPELQYFAGCFSGRVYWSHEYRFLGCGLSCRAVDLVFAPAHWLDQRIRTDYWLAFEVPAS